MSKVETVLIKDNDAAGGVRRINRSEYEEDKKRYSLAREALPVENAAETDSASKTNDADSKDDNKGSKKESK